MFIIYTGDGKGKTTAALGLVLRAAGHGMTASIIQLIKTRTCGEHRALAEMAAGRIEIHRTGTGFVVGEPTAEAIDAARAAVDLARVHLTGGAFRVVILDEAFGALAAGLISEGDLLGLADARPEGVHLAMTGRGAPAGLIERADLVTEMRNVKHPYDRGRPAEQGIDF